MPSIIVAKEFNIYTTYIKGSNLQVFFLYKKERNLLNVKEMIYLFQVSNSKALMFIIKFQ
jgi:hypothetical protein